jgi:hypothetical protein
MAKTLARDWTQPTYPPSPSIADTAALASKLFPRLRYNQKISTSTSLPPTTFDSTRLDEHLLWRQWVKLQPELENSSKCRRYPMETRRSRYLVFQRLKTESCHRLLQKPRPRQLWWQQPGEQHSHTYDEYFSVNKRIIKPGVPRSRSSPSLLAIAHPLSSLIICVVPSYRIYLPS